MNNENILDCVKVIKDNCSFLGYDYKNREIYHLEMDEGYLDIKLCKADNEYLDLVYRQCMSINDLVYPISWEMSNLKDTIEEYFSKIPKYILYSSRKYGEPKLSKPKELSNIKSSFSGEFIPKKCNCQCFIKDDDLWIKHTDYFSSMFTGTNEDMGKPTSYILNKYFNVTKKEKFVYCDNWASIVLRNEAWICFKDIKNSILRNNETSGSELLFRLIIKNDNNAKKYLLGDTEYENQYLRFFEDICDKYKKEFNNEK